MLPVPTFLGHRPGPVKPSAAGSDPGLRRRSAIGTCDCWSASRRPSRSGGVEVVEVGRAAQRQCIGGIALEVDPGSGSGAGPEARAKLAGEQEARGKLEAMTQWLRGADDEKSRTGPESR